MVNGVWVHGEKDRERQAIFRVFDAGATVIADYP
jgi:hypothetical protein